jgi:hypothetical protein
VSPTFYRRLLRLRPRLPRVARSIAKLIHSPTRQRTRGSSNKSSMLGDGTASSFSSSSTRSSLLLWFVLMRSLSRDTGGLLLPPHRLPICKIAQRKGQNPVCQRLIKNWQSSPLCVSAAKIVRQLTGGNFASVWINVSWCSAVGVLRVLVATPRRSAKGGMSVGQRLRNRTGGPPNGEKATNSE